MKKFNYFLLLLTALALPAIAHAEIMSSSVPQTRQQITLSFAPLVKQIAPAVVNIYTQKLVQQRVSPLFEDPIFRQFFGGGLPPGFSRQRLENSLGSGVIIKSDGLIITSNHVIAGADEIRVVLSDRREFDAKIVSTDEKSDLAVLRVATKGELLPFLELKDSDDAQVGDLVLAIGNPFGVGQTVTSGIISAMAHTAVGSSDLGYFIQTDAAINPGNSGGALVTMDGRLVGINAAIFSQSGGNLGIGFAVPSNLIRGVLDGVSEGKKNIIRPWLGVDGQAVTPDLAASLNMAKPVGFLVNGIHSASPAAKAGLKIGDVIIAVNNNTVDEPESYRYRIATLAVGSVAKLAVIRKGQRIEVDVPLILPPEDPARDRTPMTGRNPLGGARVENLSPAVAEETGIRSPENGVVIMEIKEGFAGRVGMRVGDVVLSINGANVKSVSELIKILKQPAQAWRINLKRGESILELLVGG